MKNILLYHHLGLGDHIICNGLVREYCKKYEQVAIFSKPHNYASVSFMFRDLPNLTVIQGDDKFARRFMLLNKFRLARPRYDYVKIVSHEFLERHQNSSFDKEFYKIAGIDFVKKWDSFFVKRERERELFNQVVQKGDYIFVHEDVPRGYIVNKKLIRKDYAIFIPERKSTDNIFDYCTIIEEAKEVHVIDSSFLSLIDCLPYKNKAQKLYFHQYARENNSYVIPTLKKKWNIIKS